MPKADYTIFNKTRLVKLVTYTNNKEDNPPKQKWDETLWIERGEDWYALMSPQLKDKVVRVVTRQDWINEDMGGLENL